MKVKDILKDGSQWIKNERYDESIPVVSVLLPTFKRAKSGYFEKAVQSVLNQTFKNLELIIIDDCSVDGTFKLIQHFMRNDVRVNCIRHTYNIGLPAISEYEGYMKARGEYIAFIFDDNEWERQYIEKTISYMIKMHYKAAYGIVYSYDKNNISIPLGEQATRSSFLDIYTINFIANGGVVLHREVIETVGLYDPHISLTRICDWDLWRRVSQKYIFAATGINASKEYGAQLEDSLGNTVPMNAWISAEQMSKERNELLLPCNFLEYDICDSKNCTDLFFEKLHLFFQNYDEKKWYRPLDKKSEVSICNITKKRIFIFVNDLNATVNLAFIRVLNSLSKNYIIRFIKMNNIIKSDFVYAEAALVVRDLRDIWGFQKICLELNIPLFYYIDDNFIVLKDEMKKSKDIGIVKEFAKLTNYSYLQRFQGIFLSSCELKTFFEEKKLHENLYLLEPGLGNIEDNASIEEKDQLVIAFMGGSFRAQLFLEVVVPALMRLRKKTKIKLLCPKKICEDIIKSIKKEIDIIEFEYTSSVDLLLQEYGREQPDILIHCGPEKKNNLYKTENALLNAVKLNAVLVVSNVFPYRKTLSEKGECFVLAENTELDWYEKLLELYQNPTLRKDLCKAARQYCIARYNSEEIVKSFNKAIGSVGSVDIGTILQRHEELYSDLYYHVGRFSKNSDASEKAVRSLYNENLCLSKLVQEETSYRIRVNVANWSELGVCFSSYGECFGEGTIYIYDGKSLLREIKFFLEEYVRDFWTYFEFEPIEDSYNKVYTVQFKFQYERGSSYIGIFEDNTRRSFSYKVLNKVFNYRKSKLDVLFTDCRS